MWVIRKIFSCSRVGWGMVGSLEIVLIRQRWIDGHLRESRIGPRDVGLVIIQLVKR